MSAGGISYDMVFPRRTVTLPSVESWGTNMNILKDPPKSIHTRKIDKVGDTQEYTLMLQASGDRFAENIQVYPRGINPMVSVNYGNQGTLGGQNRQAMGAIGGARRGGVNNSVGSRLPYNIQNFRPPVLTGFDLLPLSRLPRVWTYAFANPSMPNFVDQSNCHDKSWAKAIKEQVMQASVRPTATYNLDKPLQSFKVDNAVVDRIQVSGKSGVRTMDITNQEVQTPSTGMNNDYQQVNAITNLQSKKRTIDQSVKNTDKYIGGRVNASGQTNISSNLNTTPIESFMNINVEDHTKDALHTSASAGVRGTEIGDYMHSEVELENKRPNAAGNTNISTNYQKNVEHYKGHELDRNAPLSVAHANTSGIGDTQINNATEYYGLPQRKSLGGFEPKPSAGNLTETYNPGTSLNTQRHNLRKKAYEGFLQKFSN